MPLSFAYGSNMDVAAMKARCPASRPLGPARLAGHRFMITADGYAGIVRAPRGLVHGLLWDLALSDVPALDRYESLATGLFAKATRPVITAAGPRRALVYLARSTRPGAPRPGYLEGVLAAAEAAGLPAEYRREIAAWGPAPAEAAPVPAVRPRFAAPPSVRLSR